MENWKCKLCNLNFTTKSSLKRHDNCKHSLSRKLYKCDTCSRSFTRIDILKQHTVTHQAPIFECFHCSKKFHRKSVIINHITELHPPPNPCIFECAYCSKTFPAKRNLIHHIFSLHRLQFDRPDPNKTALKDVFECTHCGSTFKRKWNLRRHISTFHSLQKQKLKKYLTCLKCSKVFSNTTGLNNHYVRIHGIVLRYENLEFDTVKNYEQWLEKHQHETITQYRIWYKKRVAGVHTTEHLICHRSRDFHNKLEVHNRKRCLKTNGYKKLGGICPADIRVRIENDGRCFVRYQKTHIGHNIEDKSELGLIYTSKIKKNKIAAKIQSSIPLAQINLLEINIIEKQIRGKVTCKLSILRNRHRVALEEYRKNASTRVIVIDRDTFFVHSFVQTDTLYSVSKNELKECFLENKPCGLVCDLCNICFHTFKCTCEDTSNMCKHIHLVGLYLRHQQLSESGTERLHLVSNEAIVENTNAEYHVGHIENRNIQQNEVSMNAENLLEYESDSLAKCRQKINEAMQFLTNFINTGKENEINYVFKKYLSPIPAALDALRMSIPVQTKTTIHSGKIQS